MKDIEKLVLKCVKRVLENEGYSTQKAIVAIQWNYNEIKSLIEEEEQKND